MQTQTWFKTSLQVKFNLNLIIMYYIFVRSLFRNQLLFVLC